jgi:phospholipid-binding lipoprotein MlaA
MNLSKRNSIAVIMLGVLALTACSSIPAEQRVDSDPWESMNRTIFIANISADKVTTKPLARGYRKIVPGPIRIGISNFFRNLTTPRSALNNVLQGKPGRGFSELGRFLLNSTLGIGGLIDVATAGDMPEYREDFGQTAAVWGIPPGPYVMLPILGPQTLRDAITLPLDIVADPLYNYRNTSVRDKLYVLRLIDLRYRLLVTDGFLESSKDPYVTTRESYLQNRDFDIYDGDPPEDDDFFDEFLEEEE